MSLFSGENMSKLRIIFEVEAVDLNTARFIIREAYWALRKVVNEKINIPYANVTGFSIRVEEEGE